MKGALHVHSTWSDGEFTLAELRDVYLAAGCSFACVTDHADGFDAARVRGYVDECATLSDERFRFIPGLEFTCAECMHILGYGVTELVESMDPRDVIRHIHRCGGVSAIAHPKNGHFEWIAGFEELPHGLEVWNTKYDGRYAPRAGTFALLRRLQARRADLRAFYGQDLHWRHQYRGLLVCLDAAPATPDAVLDALRSGAFCAEKDGARLPADGALPEALLRQMARAHRRSARIRSLLKSAKALADRMGLRVPAGLKAHVRRVI